ncbi:MAG: hypothetical protein K2W96_04520 [Gemmataceae bacterium]|nr:hypothetical protein [Gemmataceae bacterium]
MLKHVVGPLLACLLSGCGGGTARPRGIASLEALGGNLVRDKARSGKPITKASPKRTWRRSARWPSWRN